MTRRGFTLVEALAGAVLVGMLGVAMAQSVVLVRHATQQASREALLMNRSLARSAALAQQHASIMPADRRPAFRDKHTIVLHASSFGSHASSFSRSTRAWDTVWVIAEAEGVRAARWVAVPAEAPR